MLPKKYRLSRKNAAILRAIGHRRMSTDFQLIFLLPPQIGISGWLIVVPKKNIPQAYQRNHSKRIISEALRQLMPAIKQPIAAILIVKKPIFTLCTADVKIRLTTFFKTARIFL